MTRTYRDPKTMALAQAILDHYKPESVEEMNAALKDIFGPLFEALLQGEMNHHLGYKNNDKCPKQTVNRRNGYGTKTLKTSYGVVTIDVPRDRDGTFEPRIVPKRKKDVSEIEGKVLSMYAKGMSQRDISSTIEDIYGFTISHDLISDITDTIVPQVNQWRNRPLQKCYAFLFVDCMYVTLRNGKKVKDCAVYTILGYDLKGQKNILGLWLSELETKSYWLQVFHELKCRGVEDVFFVSMDWRIGLEEGAKAVFPNVIVQRCIVHMVRNSIKHVPLDDYKKFSVDLKKIYGASNLKNAQSAYESFCRNWQQYPGAVDVWKRNFKFVEQLFDYGTEIRKIMYTTNAIEAINSSFRKVTKKGAFPSEKALFKLLYLRCLELEKKWDGSALKNWTLVLNQLKSHDFFSKRVMRYLF